MLRNGRQVRSRQRQDIVAARATLVVILFFAAYVVLLGRMVQVQVLRHAHYAKKAAEIQNRPFAIPATRGQIRDRHGAIFATNLTGYSVSVRPDAVNKSHTKEGLAVLAAMPDVGHDGAERLLAREDPALVCSWIPADLGDKTKKLGIPGIDLKSADKRVYPQNRELAYLVGLTDMAGDGTEGIEHPRNKELGGADGYRKGLATGLHSRLRFIPGHKTEEVEPQDGQNIVLTIDLQLQHIVERYLAEGFQKCKPKRGIAIMMDPYTGEILAFAVTPSPDPNNRKTLTPDMLANYGGMWDAFEPGSTLKPFTVCGALDKGKITMQSHFYCGGTYAVGNRTVHCHIDHGGGGHGSSDPRRVVVMSCNVAMAQIALRCGSQIVYDNLRAFGFGEKTGSDLPKESSQPIADPDTWRPIRLANISFGQGVAVTPLQLVTAYSVFANGGLLMEPHCILALENGDGVVTMRCEPKERRRVIPLELAKTMGDALFGVVEEGTADKTVRMDEYTAAGKTGTAQKAGPHGYGAGFVASFVGYAPYTNPRFALIVIYDAPTVGHFGASVAGPVWKAIAEETLRTMRVPPDRAPSAVKVVSAAY